MRRSTRRNKPADLFGAVPQSQGRAESETIYAAVGRLRAAGKRVTRAGRHHIVDGKRLSDLELVLMARS